MSFSWRYEDTTGGPVPGPAVTFDDQAEAEDWFSTTWPDLLESGVKQVTLLDGETEVYGPMGLRTP
ncbi:hypothetical protein [Actinokineospora spheciospongiae]|uniref:hypothetical protein n=1 Tax=Actinokineospora spheciospongiae TaxID=909613 RepID=UPI000D71B80B|nr:hypothetical protein [Actinokineospora spheciospongiae]PWW58322.1 hypothetical protein DFQ13_109114 [Actinokineospora spheciospongiae]